MFLALGIELGGRFAGLLLGCCLAGSAGAVDGLVEIVTQGRRLRHQVAGLAQCLRGAIQIALLQRFGGEAAAATGAEDEATVPTSAAAAGVPREAEDEATEAAASLAAGGATAEVMTVGGAAAADDTAASASAGVATAAEARAAELAAEQERLLAESGEARAKTIHAKRQERARRQARMRLRGTGLETQVDPGGVGPKAERRPNVTRNGRRAVLPPVEAVKKSKSTQQLPSLVDQLSRHRIAKATPSRRHFNLLPHVTQSRPNPAWLQRAQRHLPPLLPPTHMFGEDPAVLRAELEAARAENARLREVIETGKMTRSISQPWYL